MVTGWRRAFCTSIRKERETTTSTEKQQQQHCNISNNTITTAAAATTTTNNNNNNKSRSPRITAKLGFFSNPSTPRNLQSQSSTTTLSCKTATTTTCSLPNSPKLQCKTSTAKKSNTTTPSPNSPFTTTTTTPLSLLKSTLCISSTKSSCTTTERCGICLQTVKSGQGTAIFTAECAHVFHFPCVAARVKEHHLLLCPVCNTTWKELPLLSLHQNWDFNNNNNNNNNNNKIKNLRVYNDDESLMTRSPTSIFNPIPELEENDVEEEQFQGFCVNPAPGVNDSMNSNVEVSLLSESAVVASAVGGRSYETHVVVLKVRAPPCTVTKRGIRRAPVDLVAVMDISERMCGDRSLMMKRAMRLVISSLGAADRFSIVVFSAVSKRLLPLRRMTADGRRAARRIVDALGSTGSQGMSVNDALKKAAKVIEDRKEKNPIATIMIFSNGQDDWLHINSFNQNRSSSRSSFVTSTRFSHSEIPVHYINFGESHAPVTEDALTNCVGGLLRVAVQDLKLQLGFVPGSAPAEIAAVYSLTGRTAVFEPGSVRVGDLHPDEERELLVELRVPGVYNSNGSHRVISVRSSFREPLTPKLIITKERGLLVPAAQAVRSSVPGIQRLRNLHVSTRAVAESRRLMEQHNGDLSRAYRLLNSARALLLQSSSGGGSAGVYVRGLEAELAELNRRRQHLLQSQRQTSGGQKVEEKPEPLTPTSAWRAAERLAKVAIMRKHMNRVGDLHGFENARF